MINKSWHSAKWHLGWGHLIQNVVMLSFMLNVIYAESHKQAHYAVCHCAKCCHGECHYAKGHDAISVKQ